MRSEVLGVGYCSHDLNNIRPLVPRKENTKVLKLLDMYKHACMAVERLKCD